MINNYTDISNYVDLDLGGRYCCSRLEPVFHDLISKGMGDLAEAISGEDALPNSYLPGDERGQDPASLLKSYLPSTRARLAYLKARESDPITNSPLEMGDIIQGYYEELWSEDPGLRSKKDMEEYMCDVLICMADGTLPLSASTLLGSS